MTETHFLPEKENSNKTPTYPNLTIKDTAGYFAGILYTTQRMIQQITEKSGPLASNNEYQVHYEGLTFRLSKDNSFVDITIPSVVYNYNQTVGPATIEFSLKDVLSTRETVAPLTKAKNTEISSKFKHLITKFAEKHGLSVTLMNNSLSNIHRHPGALSSFSGTDYDKNPDNPGIVFPFKAANMAGVYSSIIIHNPTPVLCHTEYRVANKNEDTLTYYEGSCFTYCKGYTKDIPAIYSLFTNTTKVVPSFELVSGDTFNQVILAELRTIFESVDYEPNTDCIQSDNLEAKKTVYTTSRSWQNYDDEDEDLTLANYVGQSHSYTSPYSTHANKKQKLHVPHIGKPPLLNNLVEKHNIYGNKLFTTKYGKYLGSDLIDAWLDYESDICVDTNIAEPTTIDELLDILDKMGIADMYAYPYDSKAAGGK